MCKTVIKTFNLRQKDFVFCVCSLAPDSPPHEHCKAGYQRPHTHTQTKQSLLGEINFFSTGSWVHLNGVATVWCPPCLPGSASLQWLPRVWNRNWEVQECTVRCEEWTIPRRMQERTGPFFDTVILFTITNIAWNNIIQSILLRFVVFALAPQECLNFVHFSHYTVLIPHWFRKVVGIGRNKEKNCWSFVDVTVKDLAIICHEVNLPSFPPPPSPLPLLLFPVDV